MTWTSTRPKPPYAWRSLVNDTKGIVLTVDEARDLGLVYPAEFCQLPPVPARKTAREELRDANDKLECDYNSDGNYAVFVRAARRFLAEPEIDAERLLSAMRSADIPQEPRHWTRERAQRIASAYAKDGAS